MASYQILKPFEQQYYSAGRACWVAGWGKVNFETEETPRKLKEMGLNIFSEDYCRYCLFIWLWCTFRDHSGFSDLEMDKINFDLNICAGQPDKDGNGLTG